MPSFDFIDASKKQVGQSDKASAEITQMAQVALTTIWAVSQSKDLDRYLNDRAKPGDINKTLDEYGRMTRASADENDQREADQKAWRVWSDENKMPGGRKKSGVVPVLQPLDDGYETIRFQFSPQSATEDWSQDYAVSSPPGRMGSSLHWVKGTKGPWAFEATFAAGTPEFPTHESLHDFIEKTLKGACTPDPLLGRPPQYGFTWGTIQVPRVVIILGQIRYSEMAEDYEGTNYPMRVTVPITLRRHEPIPLQRTYLTVKTHDTLYVSPYQGEQWEHIAKRVYGAAEYGVALRNIHPGSPVPVGGVTYKIPDRDEIGSYDAGFTAPFMAETFDADKVRRTLLAARATAHFSSARWL